MYTFIQRLRPHSVCTHRLYEPDLQSAVRALSTSSHLSATALPPRPKLPDSDLHHVFLKGSGPGGQKINKTNSAVQLTHLPTGTVVKSQATRSRSQNYKIARDILAEKIELMEKGDDSRAAKKIAVKSKRKASAAKKSKRKYRALDDEKKLGEEAAVEDYDDPDPEAVTSTPGSEGENPVPSLEGSRSQSNPTPKNETASVP